MLIKATSAYSWILSQYCTLHRSHFYDVMKHSNTEERIYDDEQILGAHLAHEHSLKGRGDFNCSYKVDIFAHCSPPSLRKTEQLWINKLKTLRPYGLNQKWLTSWWLRVTHKSPVHILLILITVLYLYFLVYSRIWFIRHRKGPSKSCRILRISNKAV